MNTNIAEIKRLVENPIYLLDQIDVALEDLSVEDLPLVLLSSDDEPESYRDIDGTRPRHRVLDAILKSWQDQLVDVCCVRGEYCKTNKKHAETISVCSAVADSLASATLQIPLPLATVAVYCVRSHFLDNVCDCDDNENKDSSRPNEVL